MHQCHNATIKLYAVGKHSIFYGVVLCSGVSYGTADSVAAPQLQGHFRVPGVQVTVCVEFLCTFFLCLG